VARSGTPSPGLAPTEDVLDRPSRHSPQEGSVPASPTADGLWER